MIDDLVSEVNKEVEKGNKILITTLTKRMAEELTDYMKDSIKRVVTAVSYSGNREPHATLFGDVRAVITLWRP